LVVKECVSSETLLVTKYQTDVIEVATESRATAYIEIEGVDVATCTITSLIVQKM